MEIEILGSGGALPAPRPGCSCRICTQARSQGVPAARTGPGIFVAGPNLLVDASEDIRQQLNRSGIRPVEACVFSHWHPDHTLGLRVFEHLNWDVLGWPPQHRQTAVYLPEQVAKDFRERNFLWGQLQYLQHTGLITVRELRDGESFTLAATRITPFPLAERYVYAFLLEENGQRVLLAPDEVLGWHPQRELGSLDLAVIPMGIPEFHPLTGERRIPQEHPLLHLEATFEQVLEIVAQLHARVTVLTHIDELAGLAPEELDLLAARYQQRDIALSFSYDGLRLVP